MSDTPLFVRVLGNLDDLRKTLAEGTTDIITTSNQLKSMGNAYDGSRIIQQAGATAQAIQNVGGVTNLTAAEQAKANTILQGALDKYAALGKEAPAGMKDLAAATSQASAATGGFIGWLEGLGRSFVARVAEGVLLRDAVRQIIDIGKQAFENAAGFVELSEATGLSIQAVQQLSYVGAEFGVTGQEMARGVEQLSAKLANGDKNATSAVQMLGLSVKNLIAAGPEEAFLQIGEAVGRVEDPATKAGIAYELWGGKLARILLPALGDLRAKLDDAAKSGAMISDQSAEDAKAFETWWSHALTTVESLTVTVATGFGDLAAAIANAGVADELGTTAAALDAATDATKKHSGADIELLSNAELLQNKLTALRNAAVEPLTASQKTYIGVLKSYGESEADIAKLIDSSEIAVHLYEESVKSAAATDKKAAEDRVAANHLEQQDLLTTKRLWDEYYALRTTDGGTAADAASAQIDKWVADQKAAFIKANTDSKGYFDATTENAVKFFAAVDALAGEKRNHDSADWGEFATQSRTALQDAADKALETYNKMASSGQFFRAELDKQLAKYHELQDAANGYGDTGAAAADKIAAATKRQNDELEKQNAALAAAAKLLRDMGGSQTYDLSTPEGMAEFKKENPAATVNASPEFFKTHNLQQAIQLGLVDLYAGYRADGGPVDAGKPYMVGERGPERFVPSVSGTILPSGTGGGGSITIHVNVTQPLGTPQQIAAAVGPALITVLRNQGVRFPVSA